MLEALNALAQERGITTDTLLGALADALESAYKRMPGAYEYAWVTIDPDTFDIRVFAQELDEDGEPTGPEIDVTPEDFGRIAAQTAKQVMTQRLREIDREQKYEEYAGREGDIVTGIIQQSDTRYTLLDLGRVEALLPQAEQVPYERPEPNTRLKAYIVEVRKTSKGPQIVVSRTHPGLIKRLFELEVPEIADGVVEIKACAREPGHRTKIAVWSNDGNVDPVGACVGRPRRPGAHGRQRAAGREDRHRPVLRGPRRLRRQGAVAGEGQGGPHRRGHRHRHGHRPRLPALAGHRQGGPERPPGRPPHRMAHRHQERDPAGRGGRGLAGAPTYAAEEYAEGEWVENPDTGELEWQPAEGGPAVSAEEWAHLGEERRRAADRAGRRQSAAGRRGRRPAPPPATVRATRGRLRTAVTGEADDAADRSAPASAAGGGRRPASCRRVARAGDGSLVGRPYTAWSGCVAVRRVARLFRPSRPAWSVRPGPPSSGGPPRPSPPSETTSRRSQGPARG